MKTMRLYVSVVLAVAALLALAPSAHAQKGKVFGKVSALPSASAMPFNHGKGGALPSPGNVLPPGHGKVDPGRPFERVNPGNTLPHSTHEALPPGLRDKPENQPGVANHLRKLDDDKFNDRREQSGRFEHERPTRDLDDRRFNERREPAGRFEHERQTRDLDDRRFNDRQEQSGRFEHERPTRDLDDRRFNDRREPYERFEHERAMRDPDHDRRFNERGNPYERFEHEHAMRDLDDRRFNDRRNPYERFEYEHAMRNMDYDRFNDRRTPSGQFLSPDQREQAGRSFTQPRAGNLLPQDVRDRLPTGLRDATAPNGALNPPQTTTPTAPAPFPLQPIRPLRSFLRGW
jgi:hypothetical protein